ncbi:hypothetical protein LSAT2_002710 [Lamellibrachia satsuma]|nr:hypothetical protein LSAT2_002710 [Lamellibrachia satsuma]
MWGTTPLFWLRILLDRAIQSQRLRDQCLRGRPAERAQEPSARQHSSFYVPQRNEQRVMISKHAFKEKYHRASKHSGKEASETTPSTPEGDIQRQQGDEDGSSCSPVASSKLWVRDLARLHRCAGLDTYVTATLELELQCQLHAGILLATTVRELGVSVCLEQLGCTNDETGSDTPTENWDNELIAAPHLDYHPMLQQYHQNAQAYCCDDNWDAGSWDGLVKTGWENLGNDDETETVNSVSVPRLINSKDKTSDFTWENSNPRKLFVNNISFQSRMKEVWDFFEQFGPVEHFQLLRDRNNRPKGTGFVTFKSVETATKVLGLPEEDLTLRYRVLYVQAAGFWKAQRVEDATSENKVTSQTDSDVEEETSGLMHIHDLNDDVMMRVFGWLHLRERIQSERVCKRWRHISQMCWRTMEQLKFDSFFVGFGALTDRGLCNLLKRGSQSLKSLDLSLASRQLADGALTAIGRHCPNLIRLNAAGMSATNRGLKQFTEPKPQIQWISLRDCHNIGEDGLWWLFHRCKELKYIDLTANKRFVGKCLHMLSCNIDTLILNCCTKLQDRGVDKIALRCPALTELQLNECTTLTDHCLSVLPQHCHLLAVFRLCGIFHKITSNGLKELGKLELLQELYLSNNLAVDDNVLAALGQGCKKLRILDVTSCHRGVTDAGLVSLSQCPLLHDLSLSYLHKITDSGLEAIVHISRLTRLIARCCGGITDSVLQLLSIMCFDLCTLDLSGNQQITNVTMQAFLESLAAAPERQLSLYIGGTSITSDDVIVTDNMTLCSRDVSVHHFRQDRDLMINLGFYDSDDSDEGEHADYLNESNSHSEGHGAASERVVWAPSEEMAELFLECDDPLAAEEWDIS